LEDLKSIEKGDEEAAAEVEPSQVTSQTVISQLKNELDEEKKARLKLEKEIEEIK
jgi:hypothetical protein